ncbi:MAG: hypothetical protein IJB79_00330 [Candidatus Gastranaerophilales bacterium]|nr:hypothetical protein [Candidatus Gastranaerophilales bacterium]
MDFIFYLTLFLFISLFGAIDNGIDYDFWARLVVGKSFFQTGTLFNQDFYSYGTTHEFIDHEWGSSLIFYLLQDNFGDIGLYIFKTLMLCLTFFIITKIIKLEKNDAKLHFLFFYAGIQTISVLIFSTIRCNIFSFIFFVLYLYLLKRIKKNQEYRLLWCLPVLNIIWANMHGGFAIGLMLIAIFAFGEFLNNKKDNLWKLYSYTFLISCATTLINPYGLNYIKFIFDAFILNREHIMEWHSAFFTSELRGAHFKFILYFSIVFILFGYQIIKNSIQKGAKNYYNEIDKTKWLIIIFSSLIALKALRCHTFFIFSILSLCYNDFYNIFNKQLPKILDKAKAHILLYLIFISFLSRINDFKFLNTSKEEIYPIYAAEFLKINNIKGNVLANFHTGSYLAYKLYPNNYVYMDGRYEEVYDVDLINKMADIFLTINYKNILKKYHTDIIIIENNYPLKYALSIDKNWAKAWEDEKFTLYLTKEKYKKTNYKQPSKDKNYYNKTKFETSIDWLK